MRGCCSRLPVRVCLTRNGGRCGWDAAPLLHLPVERSQHCPVVQPVWRCSRFAPQSGGTVRAVRVSPRIATLCFEKKEGRSKTECLAKSMHLAWLGLCWRFAACIPLDTNSVCSDHPCSRIHPLTLPKFLLPSGSLVGGTDLRVLLHLLINLLGRCLVRFVAACDAFPLARSHVGCCSMLRVCRRARLHLEAQQGVFDAVIGCWFHWAEWVVCSCGSPAPFIYTCWCIYIYICIYKYIN